MCKKIKFVVILAGGVSKRFWPLGDKNVITINDESLILKQVKLYSDLAQNTIVVANKFNFKTISNLLDNRTKNNNISVVVQDKHGQADAILAAQKYGIKGPTLIVNNNDIVESKKIVDHLIKNQSSDLIITAFKPDDYFPGGYLKVVGKKVLDVVEKPDPEKIPSPYVKIDVNYFRTIENFLPILQKTRSEKDDKFEVALSEFSKKYKTTYILYKGEWTTLKYPWHVLDYMERELKYVKKTIGEGCAISASSVLTGNIVLGNNVTIHEYAKLNGPCYIGDNTIIGNYTLVTHSRIGKNCMVGAYTEITRSYVGDNVYFHRNYIGDSVIMDGCFFGAGTVVANMRLDKSTVRSLVNDTLLDTKRKKLGAIIGKGVKTGINCSFMPGVKIAEKSLIKPAEMISRDIR